ncbi:MAG: phosphopantetheine-binding protein, partial [Geminicoccaceae bacterium]|nr:phosphopantetheine-binding protein [Geminicoccaceae bacterium]
TSLKAVQLIVELKRRVEIDVPIVALFAEPTVRALARYAGDRPTVEEPSMGLTDGQLRGAARRAAPRRRRVELR